VAAAATVDTGTGSGLAAKPPAGPGAEASAVAPADALATGSGSDDDDAQGQDDPGVLPAASDSWSEDDSGSEPEEPDQEQALPLAPGDGGVDPIDALAGLLGDHDVGLGVPQVPPAGVAAVPSFVVLLKVVSLLHLAITILFYVRGPGKERDVGAQGQGPGLLKAYSTLFKFFFFSVSLIPLLSLPLSLSLSLAVCLPLSPSLLRLIPSRFLRMLVVSGGGAC
jgi:hypothetical protein